MSGGEEMRSKRTSSRGDSSIAHRRVDCFFRRAQLYFDFALGSALVAGLNKPVVCGARVWDSPVVIVVSQKSQYLHFHSSALIKPAASFFIPYSIRRN
jgi:hypothetical protein